MTQPLVSIKPHVGSFDGYASLFGVPDLAQDVVLSGAFAQSLHNAAVPRASGYCGNMIRASLLASLRKWLRTGADFMCAVRSICRWDADRNYLPCCSKGRWRDCPLATRRSERAGMR